MDLDWSEADAAFRDEVVAFLDEKLTPDLRQAGRLMTSVYSEHEASMEWQRILHERGWAAPAWAVEHGGCDWSQTQHYIFSRESILAGAPSLSPMGIRMVSHAIAAFGTQEQKDFFLPRILTGEVFFCQGYSEPEAGSDLASLTMAAVDEGDDLVCTGSKIWTTHAAEANWMFCLVRTSNTREAAGDHLPADRHDLPGYRGSAAGHDLGEQVQNQVFFDGVRVPKSNVIGTIDDGWTVAKYLSGLRTWWGSSSARAAGDGGVGRTSGSGRTRAGWPSAHRRPAVLGQAGRGEDPDEGTRNPRIPNVGGDGFGQGSRPGVVDAEGSRTELSQKLTEITLEAAGPRGRVYQPHAARPVVRLRSSPTRGRICQRRTVAGRRATALLQRSGRFDLRGSNEIQRNILAKAALGL